MSTAVAGWEPFSRKKAATWIVGIGAALGAIAMLGSTGIVFAALKAGEIDLYPEYTGTIAKEILKLPGNPPLEEINRHLAPLGLAAAVPLIAPNRDGIAYGTVGCHMILKRPKKVL